MNKKLITLVALAATLVSSPVLAGHHHRHHAGAAFGIGAAVGAAVGFVGGALAAPAYESTTVVTTPAVVAPAPAVVYAPAPVYTTPVVTPQPVVYETAPVVSAGYYAPAPVIVGSTHTVRTYSPYAGGWRWRGGNCHEYRPHYNPAYYSRTSHGRVHYNPPVYRNGQWRR